MAKIKLIYAASLNRYIGKDGTIPWHIPEDLQRFKELTQGHYLVMGRKTWESLPTRPLKGRSSIVLSHTGNFQDFHHAAHNNHPLPAFFNECQLDPTDKVYWIIGGESIFKAALPYADEVHETVVDKAVEGDTEAPSFEDLSRAGFGANAIDGEWRTSVSGERYGYLVWHKSPRHKSLQLSSVTYYHHAQTRFAVSALT